MEATKKENEKFAYAEELALDINEAVHVAGWLESEIIDLYREVNKSDTSLAIVRNIGEQLQLTQCILSELVGRIQIANNAVLGIIYSGWA